MKTVSKKLIDWFHKNKRDLPWRQSYDPYQVWISEIMLQQTQVATMVPYFHRWMKTLPTIESVAQASEDTVLKLWEGLGYYSRARNIQKAARQIMNQHEGHFPQKYDDIIALPGVGEYTASAIASIAFNQDYPVVDGNVYRVLARLFNCEQNTRLPASQHKFRKWMQELLPSGQARDFNQAVMEFGALVCRPGQPDCQSCPLNNECVAYQKGTVADLPNRGKKTKLQSISVAIAVIEKDGRVFIQKRPSKGLMGGLWEFPGGKLKKGEKPLSGLKREVAEETGLLIKNIKPIKIIHHGYTRFKVKLHCFKADYKAGQPSLKAASDSKWVELSELTDYPFPAANVQLISDLLK